jgi:hypothetical protein
VTGIADPVAFRRERKLAEMQHLAADAVRRGILPPIWSGLRFAAEERV